MRLRNLRASFLILCCELEELLELLEEELEELLELLELDELLELEEELLELGVSVCWLLPPHPNRTKSIPSNIPTNVIRNCT